jgi:hypothetical protein
MLRHSLKAALIVVALACLTQDGRASGHSRPKPVARYLFGGYGPGPFGYGDFVYVGHPTYNYQVKTRVRQH